MSQLSSVEQAFYTGDYESVLAFDLNTLSSDESKHANNLVRRAQIATGGANTVIELLGADPEDAALKTYAQHTRGDSSSVETAKKSGASATTDVERHLYALVLAQAEQYHDALLVLEASGQSLDCAMLATHINLVLGNLKAAVAITEGMRHWANDHIAFNLCEAWVALRQNGEAAQKSFYIFEELNGFKPSSRSLTGEAVAQLELGRLPEAAESIRRALEIGQGQDALATSIAISSAQGEESDQVAKLQQFPHSHVVKDLKEKDELFDKIVQKYVS